MHAVILLCINQHTKFEINSFTDFKYMIGGHNFKKRVNDSDHASFVTPRLRLDIFFMHTKFGDSSYNRSRDMIAGIEIENGSCDPDHAPFRGGLSPES